MKNRLYTFLNVLGLSIGVASFTVLFLLFIHETQYDNFHPYTAATYRITQKINQNGVGEHSASVPFPLGPTLAADYPQQVQAFVRLFNFQSPSLSVSFQHKKFNEQRFFFADSTFLQVFGFTLVQGDAATALQRANSVILTQATARRYFGNTPALGRKLLFQGNIPLEVTGVVAETPRRSHIDFDLIASFSTLRQMSVKNFSQNWVWNPCWTYIVLQPHTKPQDLAARFSDFVCKYFPDNLSSYVQLDLQPLADIHLTSNLDYEISANGDIRYVYIFGGMAVFILLISIINFTNISTALASARVRSVMVIKAIGASRSDLFRFYLIEAAIIGGFAVLTGFILVEIISPFLTDLSGNPLQGSVLSEQNMLIGILVAGLLAGLLAGIYPAYYLSSFEIGNLYYGKLLKIRSGRRFRSLLVVIQFTISMLFFIATLVSGRQLSFLRNAKLGFDKEQIVVVPVANSRIAKVYPEFKAKLESTDAIVSVTAMEEVLGKSYQTHEFYNEEKGSNFYPSIIVSHDFVRTFNIEIIAGRDFISRSGKPQEYDSDFGVVEDMFDYFDEDERNAVLVNEAMVAYMGWGSPLNAIGKTLSRRTGNEKVIGVVKNFHFSSLHKHVAPFVIDLAGDNINRSYIKYVAVKIKPEQIGEGIEAIRTVWTALNPLQAFDYFFLKEKLDKLYIKEQQLRQISLWFTAIAILLACMGLFGLSSFVVEQQRREIGIRKAIGAYDYQLVGYLAMRFLWMILLSIALSLPVGYWLMYRWLQTFPYHIELSADIFLIASVIILIVSAMAIAYHTFRAARFTPMETIVRTW
ncbi:MAG: ABC transporter permease [Cytophagales bacterium]|nr:ABC transporter permease [Bernardetiaceae bacterium]MDW8205866.1 ABC transporter permease [Cytophagales bacterium]